MRIIKIKILLLIVFMTATAVISCSQSSLEPDSSEHGSSGEPIFSESGSSEFISSDSVSVNDISPSDETSKTEDKPQTEDMSKSDEDEDDLPHDHVIQDIPSIPEWVGKVNGFDIDFEMLINRDEGNGRITALHEYFASIEPSGHNEKTGIFQDFNLITISAEALTHYAIDPELTPTLYMMQHEGVFFENYYSVYGGGTIAGELSLITGLNPEGGHMWCNNAAKKYLPFSFASQFNALDIQPFAFHSGTHTFYDRHILFPNLGYIFMTRRQGLGFEGPAWQMNDKALIEYSIDNYIDTDRFYVHYMTLSGHSPYSFGENVIARRNREAVNHLPFSAQVQAYLATQLELEYAMKYLLERLEEKGIAERTLIVMTTDHYPYGLTTGEVEELAGHRFTNVFGLHKNACIIYVKGMEPAIVKSPVFTPDIVPTVLNMLGLPFDSRFLPGRDVFSDALPMAFFSSGFISDSGYYERGRNRFIPFEGVEVPEDYVSTMSEITTMRRTFARQAVEVDYFNLIADLLKPPAEPVEPLEPPYYTW